MKRIILLAFLCTTTLVMAQRINHVQEAIANYDYEAALTLIAKEKPTIPLLLQKGKAQRGLGMNTEALSTYQEIITNDTANTRAYIEAAECCRSLAKYQQALKYYEQALDLNPENKYVRIQYIGLLLSLQKFQDALGESSLMTEKDSSAIALHLQAQSFEGMGELLPATGCYYNIQEKYCLNKDYPTAIQRYEYLVSQGDSSFHTCYYLGISYYAEEKYYEAHDFLEAARKHDPENVNLLYYLGRACAKTSWKKLGVEYLEKALDLTIPKDSNMVRLYIGMTDCYKMAQMPKEQIESIRERYRKYDKQNHKLLYDMAFIYFYSLKDKKNTERCLEAFLKTRPKEDKEEEAKLNERGELVLGTKNYYNAAANWLKDIQSKQKIEDFFLGGNVPAQKPE